MSIAPSIAGVLVLAAGPAALSHARQVAAFFFYRITRRREIMGVWVSA